MSFQPAPIVWKIHLVIQFTNATAQYPRTLVAFLYQYSTICAHNTLRTSFESKTFWDFFFSPLWHVLCAHLLLMLKRVLFYSFLFFFCWIGMRCMVLFLIDVAVCFAMIPGTHGHIWSKKPFFFSRFPSFLSSCHFGFRVYFSLVWFCILVTCFDETWDKGLILSNIFFVVFHFFVVSSRVVTYWCCWSHHSNVHTIKENPIHCCYCLLDCVSFKSLNEVYHWFFGFRYVMQIS